MTSRTLFFIAAVACVAAPTTSNAQFGRLGRGRDKPDTAAASRARADSVAKPAADTAVKTGADSASGSPAPAAKKGRFGIGGVLSRAASGVVGTIASVSGNIMTGSTADLGTVVPIVSRNANTWPKSLGTMETRIIKNWGDGGDLVTVSFTQRSGGFMSKIDGTVTIDGKPADYATMGVYSSMVATMKGPRRVEVATTTGQKAGFTIPAPRGALRIVSINGQPNPTTLDLTKDVTIQLAGVIPGDTTLLLVKAVTSVLGLRGFYDTFYVRPAATITIPAAAFRNLNIAPGNVKMGANFNDSYLLVSRERWEDAQNATGPFAGMQVFTSESDGRSFAASASPEMNTGFSTKAELALPGGKLVYSLFKAGAFASRPIAQATNIAVISFAARGTTFLEKVTERTTGNSRTRETRTLTFPQLPAAVWDEALAELYRSMSPVFAQELGATILPIDQVVATPAYQSMAPYSKDDATTDVQFTQTYRGTKLISANVPISEGYGWNRVDARLMRETGANALLKVTLDLQLSERGGASMIPTLAFELVGAPNGHSASTKFVTGTIAGAGRPLKKNEAITPAVLREIMRTADFATALSAALRDFKAKEAANRDYQVIWSGR